VKPLLWNLKDRSQEEHDGLPPFRRAVKFLRRILHLKDLPDDRGGAPLQPSMLERLDEFFAHDRTRLNEVRTEGIETSSSSEQGGEQALDQAELDSPEVRTEDMETSSSSEQGGGQALDQAELDSTEVRTEDMETSSSSEQGGGQALDQAELDSPTDQRSSTQLSPESQTEIAHVLQTGPADAKESLAMPTDATAVDSINLAAKEATAQLQATHQRMEASLKSLAEDLEKRQAELSSAFEKASGAFEGVPQKITKKVVDELEKAAQDVWNRSAKQLQQQADAAAAVCNELRASRQRVIDETKKELASLAQVSLESLTKATIDDCRTQLAQISQEQVRAARLNAETAMDSIHRAAREAVAKFERAQQEMEESLNSCAEDCQKRLAELRAAMEEPQRKSDAPPEGQPQTDLQGFRQEASKQVAEELEGISKEVLNRSAKQLQEQAETTQAALGEQLGAAKQAFIEAMRKQLVTMTQTSLESLFKETTELSRSQLSRMLQEFLAKGVRELEAEQRELLKKQSQAIQKQFNALSQTYPGKPRGELTQIERATKRRVGGLSASAGVKVGLGLLIALALILAGIHASRPAGMRLRAEPPAGFFEERPEWSAKQRAREEQLARAYWALALQDVQATYSFGMKLPDDPPAEFKVEEKSASGSGLKVDPVMRTRYWEKLRRVWVMPKAWEKSPGWSKDSIRSALESAYSKFK
jgi:hypothetical protein